MSSYVNSPSLPVVSPGEAGGDGHESNEYYTLFSSNVLVKISGRLGTTGTTGFMPVPHYVSNGRLLC